MGWGCLRSAFLPCCGHLPLFFALTEDLHRESSRCRRPRWASSLPHASFEEAVLPRGWFNVLIRSCWKWSYRHISLRSLSCLSDKNSAAHVCFSLQQLTSKLRMTSRVLPRHREWGGLDFGSRTDWQQQRRHGMQTGQSVHISSPDHNVCWS
ncbi:hypothetical protein EV126DRAFT_426071 [Verticillium dahliae]|nr:hypothetical protein EV126DRAFT_426071 [Verticillium dahliae]